MKVTPAAMSEVPIEDFDRPVGRALAVLGLLISSPLLALAAVAIKASSRGPILYRAPRVGRDGRRFHMLKLRTMNGSLGSPGGRITGGQDPRVFPAGRWLRRFKIDELPQLLNVVRGEMVLVGPRPEDPSIVEDHYTPFMLQTLCVPPGLTSPGSIEYFADEFRIPDDPIEAERVYLTQLLPRKIALDIVYIRNRSPKYDAEVIVRTVASMIGIRRLFLNHKLWEREQAQLLLRSGRE